MQLDLPVVRAGRSIATRETNSVVAGGDRRSVAVTATVYSSAAPPFTIEVPLRLSVGVRKMMYLGPRESSGLAIRRLRVSRPERMPIRALWSVFSHAGTRSVARLSLGLDPNPLDFLRKRFDDAAMSFLSHGFERSP